MQLSTIMIDPHIIVYIINLFILITISWIWLASEQIRLWRNSLLLDNSGIFTKTYAFVVMIIEYNADHKFLVQLVLILPLVIIYTIMTTLETFSFKLPVDHFMTIKPKIKQFLILCFILLGERITMMHCQQYPICISIAITTPSFVRVFDHRSDAKIVNKLLTI